MYEGVRKCNNIYEERLREAVRFKECSKVYYKIYIIILYRRARRWVKSSAVPTGMEATRAHYIYICIRHLYYYSDTIYLYNVSYYIRRYNIHVYMHAGTTDC